MKLFGLVIAPHSTLLYWEELGQVLKSNNCILDGITFVKHKNINFNQIILLNEENMFSECKYSNIHLPNINNIIARDRWLRSLDFNNAYNFCKNIYLLLEKKILENNYNFFIGEVSCATNEIALILSIKHNIKFYNLTTSLYKNKYFIYIAKDIYGNKNFINEKLKNINFISEETNCDISSEIILKLKNNKRNNSNNPTLFLKNLIFNLLNWNNIKFNDEHNNFLTNLRALIRIYFKSDKNYYNQIKDWKNFDYFLYYLHYEPDLSTYIWSNNYLDQLHLIKILSNNLPTGTKLVVKEHPLSKLIRPSIFYKKINNLNNVILIESNNYSYDLIKNSKGVITLTGSVGYEAWLLGKPVMVFGNVFYDSFKDVYVCRDFDTIYHTLKLFLTYNLIKEDLVLRNNIDKYISNECTQQGTIFTYEHNFANISKEEKLNNMQSVFNLKKTIYEK